MPHVRRGWDPRRRPRDAPRREQQSLAPRRAIRGGLAHRPRRPRFLCAIFPFARAFIMNKFCVDKVKRDRAGDHHSGQSPWAQALPHPDPLPGTPRWHV